MQAWQCACADPLLPERSRRDHRLDWRLGAAMAKPKLKGDISNLKRFAKALGKALPVDYYTVFCELGRALDYELDFLHEAQVRGGLPKRGPRG